MTIMTQVPPFDPAKFRPEHFQWSQEGRVGVVTLNRVERKNALTLESYDEMRNFFRVLVTVPQIRAIVITGAGGNFCSGGDVHEIIGPLTRMDAAEIAQDSTFAHAMTKKMLHAEWNMSVDSAIDAEAEAQAVCMETQDFQRAYRAFVAKQKPTFEGD